MDLSLGMLEEARRKDLYKDFYQMTLGEELGFETNSFDSVISVGVFTTGHAPAHAFDELARVTKAGWNHRFQSARRPLRRRRVSRNTRSGLEEAGRWKLAELSEPFQAPTQGRAGGYPSYMGLPSNLIGLN